MAKMKGGGFEEMGSTLIHWGFLLFFIALSILLVQYFIGK